MIRYGPNVSFLFSTVGLSARGAALHKGTLTHLERLRMITSAIQLFRALIRTYRLRTINYIMESLILAQNERWRRVLSMQVER